ncbi:hypothetical protein PT015_24265 [Candidatus Mycobacterium wuenschmannii]|uniref:DpnII restriction endonuclease n=1 Tax=Candidatus Mycobacterium wuenschmannii TaxID=3027808 RepID=A0ABY8W283_9MYCO|nr:hypothetical protein [Candidatus Mycobacterium wuenschmannii]WIM87894.1 hypothetical protein PT015_24265 [Candidatus Mycobacterium wuenschmannii]
MSAPLSFEDYLASLASLTPHVDPTTVTPETEDIHRAVSSLAELPTIDKAELSDWVARQPHWAYVLGLIVGLSQEKLKNRLRDRFDRAGATHLARQHPADLIEYFDSTFSLVLMVQRHLNRSYGLADVLVARAGTRVTATRAGAAGRLIEDKIEAIAQDLGLPYATRTRFVGSNGQTGPADLVIPQTENALIVVAAKGFDSTGSKLTDAFGEIERMALIRQPRQFIMAVVDGIGWKSRRADLRRIHALWVNNQIDGLYTVANLSQFRADLETAARLRQLL